jgi:hypothetical protein
MAYLDVAGEWSIWQSNGALVTFTIEQRGGELTGSAINHELLTPPRSMEARGTVTDREFAFDVSWDNGTRGRYTGTLQSNGTLSGFTFDAMHPGSQATWVSQREFDVPAEPTPPAVKPPKVKAPIRAIGKARTAPPAVERFVERPRPVVGDAEGRAIHERTRTPRIDPGGQGR